MFEVEVVLPEVSDTALNIAEDVSIAADADSDISVCS